MINLEENLNDEQLDELLNFGDVDQNGEIDHKEFVRMMLGKRENNYEPKIEEENVNIKNIE